MQIWLCLHIAVMIASINPSQEISAIDMLAVLKSSLDHRRKHILQSLRLYRDQAYEILMCDRYFEKQVIFNDKMVSLIPEGNR